MQNGVSTRTSGKTCWPTRRAPVWTIGEACKTNSPQLHTRKGKTTLTAG